MRDNFYKRNFDLSESESRQFLSLGDSLIEKGFLRNFSGLETKVLLYLLTHFKRENIIEIELPLTAGALGITIVQLKKTLNSLNKMGVLANQLAEEENHFSSPLNLESFLAAEKETTENKKQTANGAEIRKQLIKSNSASEKETAAALISFIPPANRNIHRREEIKSWLNDFELEMLKELVRRVDKWLQRQGGENHLQGAYAYLKAIIDSWYQKEITTYEKLQEQDKLHRETRELARVYGINSFSSNTAQLKTFQSWLSGEQALSKELALAAIKEAVRRKRDGQPSLKYIEDNFINPIKEVGVNNLADFRRWLQKEMDNNASQPDSRDNEKSQKNDSNTQRKEKKKTAAKKDNKSKDKSENGYKWKEFFIDFDKYKE